MAGTTTNTKVLLVEIAMDHGRSVDHVREVLEALGYGWRPKQDHQDHALATDIRWHIHRGNLAHQGQPSINATKLEVRAA